MNIFVSKKTRVMNFKLKKKKSKINIIQLISKYKKILNLKLLIVILSLKSFQTGLDRSLF